MGSDAVRAGVITAYQLRTQYRTIFPDVYIPAFSQPTLRTQAVGAWLWSKKRGTVAGLAAAALHGSQWIDNAEPVELIWRNTHPPEGMIVRNETLTDFEITKVCGVSVTTRARTAFDVGRRLDRGEAVARLDALMWASPYSIEDVLLIAKQRCGARGLRQLRTALPLVDGGAASPRETALRLLFMDAGLPRPTTQIPVVDEHGRLVRVLDMGWEQFMVAAEYDGDQHRSNRRQYVKDLKTAPILRRLGWIVERAIREDRPDEIVDRVWAAMVCRGWHPPSPRH